MKKIFDELNEYLIPDVSKIIIYYLSTPIADDIHTLVNQKNELKYHRQLIGIYPKRVVISISLQNSLTYIEYQYKNDDNIYKISNLLSSKFFIQK